MRVTERNQRAETKQGVLSPAQIETLKQFGRVKIEDIEDLKQYLPEEPGKAAFEWLVNISGAIIVLADLKNKRMPDGLSVNVDEIIYLPRFFSADEINGCIGIRNVLKSKDISVVGDPSTVRIPKRITLKERLGSGEHSGYKNIGKNPFMEQLKAIRKKERLENEKLRQQEREKEEGE
jgi:hypothetical protein